MLKLCYCRIDSNLLLMTHIIMEDYVSYYHYNEQHYPEQCYHEDIDEDDDCDEYDDDGYEGEQAYTRS